MNIENFKDTMTAKAEGRGCIWENFGQKELNMLKEKYNYNILSGRNSECNTARENLIVAAIDNLNEWVETFNL